MPRVRPYSATGAVACEALEGRRLLTTWVWVSGGNSTVNEGTSSAAYSVHAWTDQQPSTSGPGPLWSVGVDIVMGGSADGADHTLASGTVTVGTGQYFQPLISKSVPYLVKRDNLVEGNESVTIGIVAHSAYTIGFPPAFGAQSNMPNPAVVTIGDDPPIVSIAATDGSATEPDYDGATADTGTFRISRSGGDMTAALGVGYAMSGSATQGDDYTLSGSATIAANASFADITLTPKFDGIGEPAETAVMTLVGLGAPGSATILIANKVRWTVVFEPNGINLTPSDSTPVIFTVLADGQASQGEQPTLSIFGGGVGDTASQPISMGGNPGKYTITVSSGVALGPRFFMVRALINNEFAGQLQVNIT